MARIIPCLVMLGVGLSGWGARAEQQSAVPSGPGGAAPSLENANIDEMVAAVQELQSGSSPRALDTLVEMLRAGQPDPVTTAVIEALGAIGNPRAIDILADYAKHRRSEVRVVVLQSLSTIQDPRVEAVLTDALRDSQADVRATAAQALGDGGYRGAVPVLFQAFERGVGEASGAIGKLGDPVASERLAGYLGRGDLPTLLEGLAEFMARSDFDVDAKVRIVDHLVELAGPEVRRFLVGQLAEVQETAANRRLVQAMRDAVAQIPEE